MPDSPMLVAVYLWNKGADPERHVLIETREHYQVQYPKTDTLDRETLDRCKIVRAEHG